MSPTSLLKFAGGAWLVTVRLEKYLDDDAEGNWHEMSGDEGNMGEKQTERWSELPATRPFTATTIYGMC